MAKLVAGVTVLSHFATMPGPSRNQSVLQLLNLLFHRYPKVIALLCFSASPLLVRIYLYRVFESGLVDCLDSGICLQVRKFCAEQMYLLLLQIGEELVGRDSSDEALEVIGETCWDGQLECITVHRDKLFSLFRMDTTLIQPQLPPRVKGTGMKTSLIDENDNYAALVDAAGY